MLLKILAFLVAAMPLFLLARSLLVKRKTRLGEKLGEVRRQVDILIYVFFALVGVVAAIAFGRMAWAWWTAV
jgi:hypothetical protein